MTIASLEVAAATDELYAVLIRLRRMLAPEYMGIKIFAHLRNEFREQITESFAQEGATDGPPWAPLSEMRTIVRGSSNPILRHTGDLEDEVMRYKGKMRASAAILSYWFPDFGEMSGKYWGLTAGQTRNPLGFTPLSVTPRPMLGGSPRAGRDVLKVLAAYFISEGLIVTEGGGNG